MALNAGDAVLTFVGDTTQIDQAFDKVNQDAEQKLGPAAEQATKVGEELEKAGQKGVEAGTQISSAWQRVARATLENNQAQKELNAALKAVKDTGGQDQAAMDKLATAQKRAAQTANELATAEKAAAQEGKKAGNELDESGKKAKASHDKARDSVDLLANSIGATLPREIKKFVAALPGVGTALSAAFTASAILVIIQLLYEGWLKLQEWISAAEKLRSEWREVEAEFRQTSISIQQEIDQQKAKFIELTDGPLAAMEFRLRSMRTTAMQTFNQISSEVQNASSVLKENSGWFNEADDAAVRLNRFRSALGETMREAEDRNQQDPWAGYRAGMTFTRETLRDLNADILRFRQENAAAEALGHAPVRDVESYVKAANAMMVVQSQLQKGLELERETRKTAAKEFELQKQQQANTLRDAEINAQQNVGQARLTLQRQQDLQRLQQSKGTLDQEVRLLRSAENEKYTIDRNALVQKLAILNQDPTKNAAAITEVNARIKVLELGHKTELLRIDAEANKQRVALNAASIQQMIAATASGTQARIDLEQKLADFYAAQGTQFVSQYQAQLQKVAEARRAWQEEQQRIKAEEVKTEAQLDAEAAQFANQYYNYLLQTARISMAEVRRIQHNAYEQDYKERKANLEKLLADAPAETAQRAQILGQLRILEQRHQQDRQMFALQATDAIELSYQQLGVKSQEQWQRETILAQEAFDQIEKSGTASYNQILEAKRRLLEVQLGSAIAAGDTAEIERINGQIDEMEARMESFGLTVRRTALFSQSFLDVWAKGAPKTQVIIRQLTTESKRLVVDMGQAAAGAIQQWILSEDSLGHALRKATAQVLAQYAARAAVEALYYVGYGFAMLATMQYDRAALAFKAAGVLAAVAAAAGAAAHAINPKDSSGSGQSSVGDDAAPAEGIQQGATIQNAPALVQNVPRLARGALVSQPTLAMLGDELGSASRGSVEVAMPLEQPDIMEMVGTAIAKNIPARGGNTFVIEGLVSPDNMIKFIRKVNRLVDNNDVQLSSSRTRRVTRRS